MKKTNKNRILNLIFLACTMALGPAAKAYADTGGQNGNGGDMCEDRIKVIRDDIQSWINRGGANSLVFPAGISLSYYKNVMARAIQNATVSCTGEAIKVGNLEKVCKNFIDNSGRFEIICNSQRIGRTSESDQYVLVHHEFAGLAGLEVNGSDGSQYMISNQISEYLEDILVKKLAVKTSRAGPVGQWRPVPESSPVAQRLKHSIFSSKFPNCDPMIGRYDFTWQLGTIYLNLNEQSDETLFEDVSGAQPRYRLTSAFSPSSTNYFEIFIFTNSSNSSVVSLSGSQYKKVCTSYTSFDDPSSCITELSSVFNCRLK